MKELLKRTLAGAVRRLPWGLRRALLSDLIQQLHSLYPSEAVELILRQSGYSHVCATGDYGVLRSEPNDLEILPGYARSGKWSEHINRRFIDFFDAADGGTYLDIGANIGLTTIPIAQNPAVHCLSFEPEPKNFSNLSANVKLNCPHDNVALFNLALAQSRTTLLLEIAPGNLGDHRIRVPNARLAMAGEACRRTIAVQAESLDNIAECFPFRMPLAGKIDAQGAEPFIVSGGENSLSKASMLVIEFSPYMMDRMEADYRIVVDFLRRRFAAGGVIRSGTSAPEPRMPISELARHLENFANQNRRNTNAYLDVVVYGECRAL